VSGCCGEEAIPASSGNKKRGRNAACPSGSASTSKACCLEREENQGIEGDIQSRDALPEWITASRQKLHQFEKYACKVFGVPTLLSRFSDSRRDPRIGTFDVVNSLFHTALLRIPSINALEGNLKEGDFQKLIGRTPVPGTKAFSADTTSRVLDTLHLDPVEKALGSIFRKAERTKAFRDETYGALRCAAIDGWEPFSSFHRRCPDCLEREVTVKRNDGTLVTRTQYYHRYVVCIMVGPLLDVVLGIEPVRNKNARIRAGECNVKTDEGEQTAALRLIDRIHETYGTFIDTFLFDSLYPNGPLLTKLTGYGHNALIVVKKEDNEPFKEALALWQGQPPCEKLDDFEKKEHVEFWDVDELETLGTFKGKIRVLRAVVTHPKEKKRTWCMAIIGDRARRMPRPTALKALRSRWHIENTAFCQWTKIWHLSHVFRHSANALMAVLLIWSLVFNLLQLFVYRRLKRPRRPKDPTHTIRHIVEIMLRDVATIPTAIPWLDLLDTK
jgi:hypothetical protein